MATIRKVIFANDHYYHIFNRGVERRNIYARKKDYNRALFTLKYYQYKDPPLSYSKFLTLAIDKREVFLKQVTNYSKHIEILAYCLMPNHFHLLLKQKQENGISIALANIQNSYTKYFNIKNKRIGPLFEGPFKAVMVETTEQLMHLSRYIHINPAVSLICTETEIKTYPWSSLHEYLFQETGIAEKKEILELFNSEEKYEEFVINQIAYGKELEKIKHLLIE